MIIHSNDIHVNLGPNNENKVFSVSIWNCNSIVKNTFNRVDLLKVHASIYNYDVMSLCETSLNDDVEIPGYNFVPVNHPSGNKRGGGGFFYKDNLTLKVRNDLSFNECLVSEVLIGKRKVFYSVCYRSPSMKANTSKFFR